MNWCDSDAFGYLDRFMGKLSSSQVQKTWAFT